MGRRLMAFVLALAMVLMGAGFMKTDVTASELQGNAGIVSEGDNSSSGVTGPVDTEAPEAEANYVTVPDVTGLLLEEAQAQLSAVAVGEGRTVQVLLQYEYAEAQADVVLAQSAAGQVEAGAAAEILLTVSLGAEPEEDLLSEADVNKAGSFGLAAYNETSPITIDGEFGDWAGMPYSWEYTYPNEENCWYWGWWEEGLDGYKTPVGTFDENVRHKVSLYTDGEYAYLYIMFARCYTSRFNGDNYVFSFGDDWSDRTQYNITAMDEKTVTGLKDWEPGVYELLVKHGDGDVSWQNVSGAKAYLKVKDSTWNAELELKIPLSQMKVQNPSLNIDRIDKLSWECPNLTYRRVYAAGASTAPFVAAGIALIGVPVTGAFVKKRCSKKGKV